MRPVISRIVHRSSSASACACSTRRSAARASALLDFLALKVLEDVASEEAGWAAQPTNDYQKAVWDQVHALPDKPLTIEFDPKKDK